MKKTTLFKTVLLLCALIVGSNAWADPVTLVSGSGSSGYSVPTGWTTSGTVEGGSYLKFDNGTMTSGEFAPHTSLSFTYSVATFGQGTNHPLTIRILDASTNTVIVEKTTSTPTSSSYITTGSPLSLGDVNVSFKIQLYAPTGKGIRLRNYSITGTPAVSFTLEATSNNDSYGSVSVTNNVITATPETNCRVSKSTPYEITSGEANVTSVEQDGNTFNVTATGDCALQINFEPIPSHTATFSVNGVESSDDFLEGESIVFPDVPEKKGGKTFMGWTATPIVGTQASAPSYVSSAVMGDSNLAYYAVYADEVEETDDISLTNSTIKSNVDAGGKGSYGSYNIDDWTGKYLVSHSGDVNYLQLGYNTDSSKSAYNSHLTTPTCTGNIKSITIETNNSTVSGRTFYLCSAGNIGAASNSNATYGSGSTTEANGSVTINVSGNTKQFHIYPNGTAYIKSITLTYGTTSYDNYCTTISSVSGTISDAGWSTFASDLALDLSTISSGSTAYYAESVDGTNVVVKPATGVVPAGEGLMIKGTAGDTFTIDVAATNGTAIDGNKLVGMPSGGTVAKSTEGSYNYVYGWQTANPETTYGFYYLNSHDATLGAGKAYLHLTEPIPSEGRIGIIFDDEETTAISEVRGLKAEVRGEFYDLSGRKVAQPTKGLYIVNGRKVVIK